MLFHDFLRHEQAFLRTRSLVLRTARSSRSGLGASAKVSCSQGKYPGAAERFSAAIWATASASAAAPSFIAGARSRLPKVFEGVWRGYLAPSRSAHIPLRSNV